MSETRETTERPGEGMGVDAVLRKVRGLLAKAEDPAVTEPEAQAYMAAADRLMLKYAIDVAMVSASQASVRREAPQMRVYEYQTPHGKPKAALLTTIAAHYGCRVLRHGNVEAGKRVYRMRAYGFPGDLDMVEVLFTSLLLQGTNASKSAGRARGSFWWGFDHRTKSRLAELRAEVIAETPGSALVLADRMQEVDAIVPKAPPAATPRVDELAYAAGVDAANRADLNQHQRLTPNAPRALTGGRAPTTLPRAALPGSTRCAP